MMGAGAGAGAGATGALMSGMFGLAGTGLQGWFAQNEASKARRHMEHMYKHRYQWQMEDMEAAGLNPILMSSGGAPGVPASPSAHGAMGNPLAAMATSARELPRLNAELKRLDKQADQIEAATGRERAQEFYYDQGGWLAVKQQLTQMAQAEQYSANAKYLRTLERQARYMEPYLKLGEEFWGSSPGKVGYWIREAQKILGGVAQGTPLGRRIPSGTVPGKGRPRGYVEGIDR